MAPGRNFVEKDQNKVQHRPDAPGNAQDPFWKQKNAPGRNFVQEHPEAGQGPDGEPATRVRDRTLIYMRSWVSNL